MIGLERLIGLGGSVCNALCTEFFGNATAIIGGSIDQQRHTIRAVDSKKATLIGDFSTRGVRLYLGSEAEAARLALLILAVNPALKKNGIGIGRMRQTQGVFFALKCHSEVDAPWLIGGKPGDDYTRRGRGEDFASEVHAAVRVTYRSGCGFKIQHPAVVGSGGQPWCFHPEFTQGLIGLNALGFPHHGLASKTHSLPVFAFKEQLAHFGQRIERIGVAGIEWIAVPQRVFVKLKPFVGHASKDHRP